MYRMVRQRWSRVGCVCVEGNSEPGNKHFSLNHEKGEEGILVLKGLFSRHTHRHILSTLYERVQERLKVLLEYAAVTEK